MLGQMPPLDQAINQATEQATEQAIDQTRLKALLALEEQRFVELHPRSARLAQDAQTHLLAGVPMAWMTRWPGAFPLFVAEAQGAHFTDADGLQYTDFCLGDTGAMTGHALPQVAEALYAQAQRGITTMLPGVGTDGSDASWVAAELSRRFGLPQWQMAMTATDANRFVLRLARQLSGRRKILVFDYCYHGSVEEALVMQGDDGSVQPRPGNLGWGVHPSELARIAQFNDLDSVEAALKHGDVAAVLTEPALTNIGIVLPQPGFLEGLRALCDQYGAYLVLDETHTICAGPGGATQAWTLHPDFLVIGKPLGGGMPAAAYGMTADIAGELTAFLHSTDVDVSGLGGTLTGSALALAAMRATLSSCLRPQDFEVAIPLAQAWAAGVQSVIGRHQLPWTVQLLGCRAEYWFCPAPQNGREAAAAGHADLEAYLHLYLLNRQVLMTPFHNMALLSPHHTQADIDVHTQVFGEAVASLFS
jgi:glutamate-1-semialdehyde 2,1-aminomutase